MCDSWLKQLSFLLTGAYEKQVFASMSLHKPLIWHFFAESHRVISKKCCYISQNESLRIGFCHCVTFFLSNMMEIVVLFFELCILYYFHGKVFNRINLDIRKTDLQLSLESAENTGLNRLNELNVCYHRIVVKQR